MYRKANLMFLFNETPMHVGSGDSLGIVDLPIQREKHTGFPKIEASSLKGSIREHFTRIVNNNKKINAAFGSEGDGQTGSNAGALGFSDARLLLFPVKSMKGIFAWVTCPRIIQKFNHELSLSGSNEKFDISKGNLIANDSQLVIKDDKMIILEEYTFSCEKDDSVSKLGSWISENIFSNSNEYWKEKIKKDIVVLTDDDFNDFVELSTNVITRIKINPETGTVQDGALFTEEYLPAESLLYSIVLTAPEFSKSKEKVFEIEEDLSTFFEESIAGNSTFQIGGNSTLGKGITTATFLNLNI